MLRRNKEIREVTDIELTELKRQLIRHIKALQAPYNGGVCSHHGLYFKAGDLSVTMLGTVTLHILVDSYAKNDDGYGHKVDLDKDSWVKVRDTIIEVAGKLEEEFDGTLLEKDQWHMRFEMEMETPKAFRFAQEANSRLPGSGSLDGNNHSKFERWDKWLEEQLAKASNDVSI